MTTPGPSTTDRTGSVDPPQDSGDAGGTATGPARTARPLLSRLARTTLARHLIGAVAAGIVLWALTVNTDAFTDSRIASVAYSFVAIAGLTVLVGQNGQISLGHGALMAVGAYTFALMELHQTAIPWYVDLVASTVVTALVGTLVGIAASRLRGPSLAGATLALAVGLPALAVTYTGAFGGNNGLIFDGPSAPASFGFDFPLERWQAWICCLAALVVAFGLVNLVRGRTGRDFRAVRDDEVAAALAGIHVARTQVTAFVVSAACAGLAGGLLALTLGTAAPGSFQLPVSVSLLAVAVLGGLGSLTGAVWGAIAIVYLPAWSDDAAGHFSLSTNVQNNLPLAVYGVILVAVMLLFPLGIQGGVRWLVRTGRHLLPRRPGRELPSSVPDERPTR